MSVNLHDTSQKSQKEGRFLSHESDHQILILILQATDVVYIQLLDLHKIEEGKGSRGVFIFIILNKGLYGSTLFKKTKLHIFSFLKRSAQHSFFLRKPF